MRIYFLGFLLSLGFFIASFLTLSDYGINWDAPIHWLRGNAYLHYILTGKKTFQEQERPSPIFIKPHEYASRYYFIPSEEGKPVKLAKNPKPKVEKTMRTVSFYQNEAWNGEYWISQEGPGHLPFADLLATASNKILYKHLGVLNDIESYNLIDILISAIGVFVVTIFTYEITGSFFAAFIAGISLALSPIFFAESHFNMKDPLQASFFAGAIWSFWHWVKSGKLAWFVVFGVFVAFALGIKWNVAVLPFILLPWLFLIRFRDWRRLGILGVVGGVWIFLFLIFIWPYAWADPIGRILSVFGYYWGLESHPALLQPNGFILPFGFNSYPIVLLLIRTPEIILLLVGIGIVACHSEPRQMTERRISLPVDRGEILRFAQDDKVLLLLWFVVPLVRVSLPHTGLYGGIRQFMEVLPAMAILAGVGAYYMARKARGNITIIIFITIITIILAIPIIRLHPNENTYFNLLAGGLKGAVNKDFVDWSLTFGNIYRQGVVWLNKNADKNSRLAHLDGSMFAISPVWLREDISISPNYFSGFEQKGEYIMTLFNPLDPPVFAARYPFRFLKPIHTVDVDGIPLLFIFKNDDLHSNCHSEEAKRLKNPMGSFANAQDDNRSGQDDKGCITYERQLTFLNVQAIHPAKRDQNDYLKIDLGEEVKVTRINVFALEKCLQTGNEFIGFFTQKNLGEEVNLYNFFTLNERKNLDKNRIEYDFPGELARYILVYPQNDLSCFVKGRITSVSYIEDL